MTAVVARKRSEIQCLDRMSTPRATRKATSGRLGKHFDRDRTWLGLLRARRDAYTMAAHTREARSGGCSPGAAETLAAITSDSAIGSNPASKRRLQGTSLDMWPVLFQLKHKTLPSTFVDVGALSSFLALVLWSWSLWAWSLGPGSLGMVPCAWPLIYIYI